MLKTVKIEVTLRGDVEEVDKATAQVKVLLSNFLPKTLSINTQAIES